MARRNKKGTTVECYYCNKVIPENSLRCPHCGKFFSAAKKMAAFAVVIIIVVAGMGFLVYNEFIGGHLAYENGTIIDDQNGNDDDDPNEGLDLAPDFTLPKVGGGSVSLSSLRGKVVLLDFMSTTCPPCETQIDILKGTDIEFSNAELNIFSISSSDTESTLSQYMNDKGVTWPFLMDNIGVSQMSGYDVKYIPTIVIINQDGYIEHWNQGVISSSELSDIIRPLL